MLIIVCNASNVIYLILGQEKNLLPDKKLMIFRQNAETYLSLAGWEHLVPNSE
jgi:hypothetical protein